MPLTLPHWVPARIALWYHDHIGYPLWLRDIARTRAKIVRGLAELEIAKNVIVQVYGKDITTADMRRRIAGEIGEKP